MVQPEQRFQSFEDYLAYDDGTEHLYELFNGKLITLPPDPGLNVEIANLLFFKFLPVLGYVSVPRTMLAERSRSHCVSLGEKAKTHPRYPLRLRSGDGYWDIVA